jgi:hypothetical protein
LQMFMPMVISKIPLSLPKLAKSKRRSREYQLNYRIIPLFRKLIWSVIIAWKKSTVALLGWSWRSRETSFAFTALFLPICGLNTQVRTFTVHWPQFHSIVMSQPPCELHYFYSIVRQSLRIIGTNAILYFIVDLFQAAGFTGNNALFLPQFSMSSMLLRPSRRCYGWINGLAEVSWCLDPFSWQCSYLPRLASWHPTGMPSLED